MTSMRMNGAVFTKHPCGCSVVGDGTIPNPIRILFCKGHARLEVKYHLIDDPEVVGFWEPCPLEDRGTDLSDPEWVGEDGRLMPDVGILWEKDEFRDEPRGFHYARIGDLVTHEAWIEE